MGLPVRSTAPLGIRAAGTGEIVVVVVCIEMYCLADLREVRAAVYSKVPLPQSGQSGHQNAHQQRYGRNHD